MIRVLRKVFSKQFCFIRCRRQHLSGLLNRGDIADLLKFDENTVSTSPKVPRAKFLGSYGLCFISICKFGSFKILFATNTITCLNFPLDSENFIFLVQTEWFLWTMTVAQAAENHRDEWRLTSYLQWGIHTSIISWTHSQNTLAAPEALSLKISSYGNFSNDHEVRPNIAQE